MRWVTVLGIALVARTASADVCREPVRWIADAGAVTRGPRCGELVISSDGSTTSQARVHIEGTFEDVTWRLRVRRVGGAPASIQLEFSHGYLMLRDGAFGLYTTEAQWAATGWQPLPRGLDALSLTAGVTVELSLIGPRLTASLDGVPAGAWDVPGRPRKTWLQVTVGGPPGVRARALVSDVSVRSADIRAAPGRSRGAPRRRSPGLRRRRAGRP